MKPLRWFLVLLTAVSGARSLFLKARKLGLAAVLAWFSLTTGGVPQVRAETPEDERVHVGPLQLPAHPVAYVFTSEYRRGRLEVAKSFEKLPDRVEGVILDLRADRAGSMSAALKRALNSHVKSVVVIPNGTAGLTPADALKLLESWPKGVALSVVEWIAPELLRPPFRSPSAAAHYRALKLLAQETGGQCVELPENPSDKVSDDLRATAARASRWVIHFPEIRQAHANSVPSWYPHLLDHFGIEIGVWDKDRGLVRYCSTFTVGKLTVRDGFLSRDTRFVHWNEQGDIFTHQDTHLTRSAFNLDAIQFLLSNAECYWHFFPKNFEKRLARLEERAAEQKNLHRDKIIETHFTIWSQKNKGWTLSVDRMLVVGRHWAALGLDENDDKRK